MHGYLRLRRRHCFWVVPPLIAATPGATSTASIARRPHCLTGITTSVSANHARRRPTCMWMRRRPSGLRKPIRSRRRTNRILQLVKSPASFVAPSCVSVLGSFSQRPRGAHDAPHFDPMPQQHDVNHRRQLPKEHPTFQAEDNQRTVTILGTGQRAASGKPLRLQFLVVTKAKTPVVECPSVDPVRI